MTREVWGFPYLGRPRLARFVSFFPSPSPPSSPFVAAFRCFFAARSSLTCDVARLRVPSEAGCLALVLPPVLVVDERVAGMVVAVVSGGGGMWWRW